MDHSGLSFCQGTCNWRSQAEPAGPECCLVEPTRHGESARSFLVFCRLDLQRLEALSGFPLNLPLHTQRETVCCFGFAMAVVCSLVVKRPAGSQVAGHDHSALDFISEASAFLGPGTMSCKKCHGPWRPSVDGCPGLRRNLPRPSIEIRLVVRLAWLDRNLRCH